MDSTQFQNLLGRPESNWLDFKRDQYRFPKGDGADVVKGELLKDILGFSNARRDQDAYIVIGVKARRGQPHELVGILPDQQFDDAELQQFVNKKTNKLVEFEYLPVDFEGKQFAVIRIPEQDGLRWLTDDFGKLRKLYLYVRVGTSTEPFTPGQIYDLGVGAAAPEVPSIHVELVDWKTKKGLGSEVDVVATHYDRPKPFPKLTEFGIPDRSSRLLPVLPTFDKQLNTRFCEEAFRFCQAEAMTTGISLRLTNQSGVTAHDVRFEMEFPDDVFFVLSPEQMPDPPKLHVSPLDMSSRFKGIRPLRSPPYINCERDSANGIFRLNTEAVKLQPGQKYLYSRPIYVAARNEGTHQVHGKLYADNLPAPLVTEFQFRVRIERAVLDRSKLDPAKYSDLGDDE